MDDLGLVVTNRWFRSLGEGGSQLREGLRFDLDLVTRLTEGLGFSFSAEGALTTRWHLDKTMKLKVLRVTIHSILLNVPIRADQDHFDLRAEVRLHWSATVGPATLVMDGAGGWLGSWADQPGGAKECGGLLRPTGVGFQLELSSVTGGGFFDFTGGPNDRYGGLVTLDDRVQAEGAVPMDGHRVRPPRADRVPGRHSIGQRKLRPGHRDVVPPRTAHRLRHLLDRRRRHHRHRPAGRHRRPARAADVGRRRQHPLRRRPRAERARDPRRPRHALPAAGGHLRVRAHDAARLDPAEERVPGPTRRRCDRRVRQQRPTAEDHRAGLVAHQPACASSASSTSRSTWWACSTTRRKTRRWMPPSGEAW